MAGLGCESTTLCVLVTLPWPGRQAKHVKAYPGFPPKMEWGGGGGGCWGLAGLASNQS